MHTYACVYHVCLYIYIYTHIYIYIHTHRIRQVYRKRVKESERERKREREREKEKERQSHHITPLKHGGFCFANWSKVVGPYILEEQYNDSMSARKKMRKSKPSPHPHAGRMAIDQSRAH